MKDNRLTIAIPTKNRGDLLRETLGNIVNQDAFLDVNIIVCNNFSNDNTSEVLLEYDRFENITIVSNQKPLTLDQNMIKVATFVKTEYFLWLGDDDCIELGALRGLVEMIRCQSYDFILLNSKMVSSDFSIVYKKGMIIDDDIHYNSPRLFFKNHFKDMPFGTLILQTKLFESAVSHIDKYMQTSHAYGGVVLDYLAKKYKKDGQVSILVASYEYILLRQVEKTWVHDTSRIMFQDIPKWYKALDPYYKNIASEILDNYLKKQFSLKTLLYHKYTSNINFKNYIPNTRYANKFMKVKYIMVMLIPRIRFFDQIAQKKINKYNRW